MPSLVCRSHLLHMFLRQIRYRVRPCCERMHAIGKKSFLHMMMMSVDYRTRFYT